MIICSPQLGISPESNLGGEVHDRELLLALAKLGNDIHIVLPLFKKHPLHPRLHYYYLPFPFIYPPYLFNILILPYLFWIYFRHRFSILRIHSPYFVGLGGIIFKILIPQVKTVATYHHFDPKKLYELLDKWLTNKFDLIFTVSSSTKEEIIQKYHVPAGRVSVLPNAVSDNYFPKPKPADLLRQYRLEKSPTLLFLGHLIARKNIPFLFSVVKNLPQSVRLIIGGDGPELSRLKSEVVNRKIKEKVIFTGYIPEKEKNDYYNLADIFVFPSFREGFGLAPAEAAACAKPVVINQYQAAQDVVVPDKSGYILPLDEKVWEKHLHNLLSDSEKMITMGKYGRDFIRNRYSWTNTAVKYLTIINAKTT